MRTATSLIAATAILGAACSSSDTGPQWAGAPESGPPLVGPAPALTLDHVSYVAVPYPASVEQRWHFQVIATLRNDSDQQLYVDAMGPVPTFVVYPDTGTSAYNFASALVPSGSGLPLDAHTIRVDTLIMQGPNEFDGHTHVGFGVLTGSMKISYAVGTCVGVDVCDHAEQVSSPTFTVTALPEP